MTRRPLAVAGALWAGVLLTAFDVWVAAGILANARVQDDFRLVYLAARLVAAHGWPSLYDFGRQAAEAAALGFNWQPYVTPPPLVVVGLPLSLLPFELALVLWTVLLVAALSGGWWLAAPGHGLERWMHLALAFGLFPAAFAIAIGQPAPLVLVALAAAWWLMKRGHTGWAGACVAALVLKPQLAVLVPIALVAAGWWRTAVVAAGVSALIAAASAALIGPAGAHGYQVALQNASTWALTRRFTISDVLTVTPPLVAFVVALVTVLAAWRARRAGPEISLAAGIAGSLLVTPYIGLQDFTLLLVAGWLVLRSRPPIWMTILLAAGFPVLEFAVVEGSLPVVLWRSAFLVGLAVLPQPEHEAAESEAEGRVQQRLVEEGVGGRADG